MLKRVFSFTVCAVLLLSLVSLPAIAITTTIGSGELWCVKEPIPPHSSVYFMFEVAGGRDETIGVSLLDQDSKVIKTWENDNSGAHEVRAKDNVKVVKACFDNRGSYYTTKNVVFYIRRHVDYEGLATNNEIDPVERRVDKLADTMHEVETLQLQLRKEQKDHRSTVEDASERVLIWCVFQVVALVGMSLFQIYFLKRFLERKSFV